MKEPLCAEYRKNKKTSEQTDQQYIFPEKRIQIAGEVHLLVVDLTKAYYIVWLN